MYVIGLPDDYTFHLNHRFNGDLLKKSAYFKMDVEFQGQISFCLCRILLITRTKLVKRTMGRSVSTVQSQVLQYIPFFNKYPPIRRCKIIRESYDIYFFESLQYGFI